MQCHKPTYLSREYITSIIAVVMLLGFSNLARAATPVKDVDAAVDKAVGYLLSQQQKDGSWETEARLNKPETTVEGVPSKYATYGGETAIVTYALLAAGQSPQSEPIKKAVAWLEHVELHGTYATGLRAQVWNLLPETDRTKPMVFARDRDRDFFYYSRIGKGANAGFYSYIYGADLGGVLTPTMAPLDKTGQPDNSQFDRSNSQYAVLGAWAVEQAGAEIPLKYWEEEDAAWKNAQAADGSWTYNNARADMVYEVQPGGGVKVRPKNANDHILNSVPTMTCAGVATLYITQDYLMRANGHMFDVCNGGIVNVNIEKGLGWLGKHIDELMSFNNPVYHYAVYGIERIGVASGRKTIGNIDWFNRGAEVLVQTQAADGSWNKTLHDTCFGTLFLVRGRAPVMMNKLIYTNSGGRQNEPWDERPRDAANLAKWMGKHSLEGFLNWQLVNLKESLVEDLHDAPILYMSGSEAINLSKADLDNLRLFVEQGGMILGNADCGKKIFATSFKDLGAKLFPKYEFRQLAPNHPIFSEQYLASKWKTRPQIFGQSNGVRELMILIPEADAGKAWQTESTKIREELFQLGGNIFLYATGKENLVHKGDTYIVKPAGEGGRALPIARLVLGDNWNPEPGAWPRLSAIMHNNDRVNLDAQPIKLGGTDLARFRIAHWTGTSKVQLTDDQRKEIKAFVDAGGTLIVDAAGGATAFADSAEVELKQIFGDAAKSLANPLLPTHALYTDEHWKPGEIRYRIFARPAIVGNRNEGRIRGIATADGRIGVFFSREDLTAGLVGEPVDGIIGYDEHAATQLMRAMVLYADAAK